MTPTAKELLELLDRRMSLSDMASCSPADRQRLATLLHHWHSLALEATANPQQDTTPAS